MATKEAVFNGNGLQLMRGDCMEMMKQIPDKSVDLVLTDPPYGIDYQSCWRKEKEKRHKKIENDKTTFLQFIKEIQRIIKTDGAVVIFSRWDVQQKFMDEMEKWNMKPKGVLIWQKGGGGMGDLRKAWALDYETAIYWTNKEFKFQNGRPASSVLKVAKVPAEKLTHPNEKPVELLQIIIREMCKKDGTVLDCFMGSGSTGEAARKSGRNFIGIEIDEQWYEFAQKKINAQAEQINMMSMLEAMRSGEE